MDDRIMFCLVVDDEPLAQLVVESYVRHVKELHLVAKCESAKEALELLRSNEVDVIFLDLDLKQSSGTEVIDKIRTLGNRYYIIITSAVYTEGLDQRIALDDDQIILVDYLTKPFSFERFLQAIRKIKA